MKTPARSGREPLWREAGVFGRAPRKNGARLVLGVILLLALAAPALAGLISQEEEVRIGAQAARRLESRYPLVADLGVQERVVRVGQAVAAHGQRDLTYHFKVLDVGQLNALAFPGGFIYATRGLMEAMPDQQLAFVLGHEVAHVENHHSIQQIETELYKQVGLSALLTLLGRDKVSGGTMNTVRVVDTIASSQYSQAQEREADCDGMLLMTRAGYDPMGAVAALETLHRHSQGEVPGFLNSLVGSHPLPEERIAAARQRAAELRSFRPAPPPAPRENLPAPPRESQSPAATPRPLFTPVAP